MGDIIIVLNEGLDERQRTTSSGTKSRYTVSVDAEPILHEFSEINLGKGPAEAIMEAIRDGIKAISQVAKPGTQLARKYAASAFTRGASWAVKRYAGGRTGAKRPDQSDALFNDSGRFAEGVFASPKEQNWTVNVPANRLDPSTFKNQADFLAMVTRLRALVPALGNPLSVASVKNAIERGIRDVLIKELKRTSDLKLQRAKAVLSLLGI